jgi:hypothetical protein
VNPRDYLPSSSNTYNTEPAKRAGFPSIPGSSALACQLAVFHTDGRSRSRMNGAGVRNAARSDSSVELGAATVQASFHSAVRAIVRYAAAVARMSVVAMCIGLTSAAAFVWVLRAQPSEPPSLDDATAWQWVSTSPGRNVYVHEPSERRSANYARAWVAVRFPSSPVSVKADLIELWEFDCRQHLSRRVTAGLRPAYAGRIAPTAADDPVSAWRRDAPETILGRILSRMCPAGDRVP